MRNFNSAEKILFSISALLLVLSSYLLYDDSLLFRREFDARLQAVGSLQNISNDVRRKTIEDFSWLPIHNEETVYLRDSLFTGASSSAILQLHDGTQLRIAANSLIILTMDGDELVLDLKFGDLAADLAAQSQLNIKAGEEISKVKNLGRTKSTLELTKKPGTSSVRANKGELTVQSRSQKISTKIAPQATAINILAKTSQKSEVTYGLPEGKILLAATSETPVELSWIIKSGKVSKSKVEISTLPDFTNIIESQETPELKLTTNSLPTNAKYFWRVRTFDEAGQPNNDPTPSYFSITQVQIPQITSPAQSDNVILEFVKNNPNSNPQLPLKWETVSGYAPQKKSKEQFHLQIARDPSFAQVLIDYRTKRFETLVQKVPEGTYYARLALELPEKSLRSLWSPTVSFSVQHRELEETRPRPPQLVTKNIQYSPRKTFDRTPASIDSPLITWSSDYKYPNYKVQISSQSDFSQILSEISTRNKTTRWEKFKPGLFYVRVVGIAADKTTSDPSDIGQIKVTLSAPQVAPIAKEEKVSKIPGARAPEHTFNIRWTQIPIANFYQIEVSQDENFTEVEKKITESTSYQHTVKEPGEYFFRVQPFDSTKSPLTGPSLRAPAAYSFYAPPMPPSPLEPFDQTSIFLQKDIEPFIWLEWKTTEEFEHFDIEISDREDFSNILIKTKVKESRFLLKDKVPLGKIYWRVRSVNGTDISFWSKIRSFSLISQRKETFVE